MSPTNAHCVSSCSLEDCSCSLEERFHAWKVLEAWVPVDENEGIIFVLFKFRNHVSQPVVLKSCFRYVLRLSSFDSLQTSGLVPRFTPLGKF